jgi:hypothetical protein
LAKGARKRQGSRGNLLGTIEHPYKKQWKLRTTIRNAMFDELIKHISKGLDAPIDVIKITPNYRLTGLQGPYKNVERYSDTLSIRKIPRLPIGEEGKQ